MPAQVRVQRGPIELLRRPNFAGISVHSGVYRSTRTRAGLEP
jgi:hypothetical protein